MKCSPLTGRQLHLLSIFEGLVCRREKRVDETEWMTKWMNGELTLEQIKDSMHEVCSDSPIRGGIVVCCKWQRREKFDRTYFKLILRSIFEQEGFHLLVSERNREVLFILLNKRMVSTWREIRKQPSPLDESIRIG